MRTGLALPLLCVLGCGHTAEATGASSAGPVVLVGHPWPAGLALFSEELAEVRAEAAAFVARAGPRGARVLPLPELAHLDELVARGRFDEDGPRCQVAPTWDQVAERRFPGALHASVTVSCSARCELGVSLWQRTTWPRRETLATWSSPLPAAPSLADVKAAFSRLVPSAPAGGAMVLGSRPDEGPLVELLGAAPSGPWRAPWTDHRFAEAQAHFDRCHERGWTSGKNDTLRIAFAKSGRVERCEAADDPPGGSPRLACLCGAAHRLVVDEGPAGRRVELRLMNQLGAAHETPRTRASLDDVSSSEPGLGLVGLFEPAAACFAAAGRPRARERIAVSFAADGRVDAARIVGDVPADLRRCVEGALLQSRSICPTTPPAGLQADLVVYTLSP